MSQVISLTDAAALSNNILIEGIVSDIITVDRWFKSLPFVVFEGLAYTFTREKRLAKAAFARPTTNLNQAKYQAGATFESVNVNLSAIIAEIIIDGQIEDQFSETNSQLQVQISSKAKAIARIYMSSVINGRRGETLVQSNNGPIGIAGGFDGMKRILDAEQGNVDDVNHPFFNNGQATQTLTLVEDDPASPRAGLEGRVYTLEDLDDLIDRVTAAPVEFLMMNSREIRTLRTLLRNTGGGTDAYMIQQAGLGSEKPVLMYQDVAVYRNDFISKAEPVNSVELVISSVTDADTLVLAADPALTVGAGNVKHLLVRGADDGVLYRYEVDSASGATLNMADVAGSFFDPESNETLTRRALNSAGLIIGGSTAVVAERVDGSSIYCGCFGELKGVVGFTSSNNAGLKMEYVGPRENENAYQYRLKWYCGFDLYNRLALARMDKVLALGA
jgi:hypothetical protein